MSEFGSVNFMHQRYKVFVGQGCIHLEANTYSDAYISDNEIVRSTIERFMFIDSAEDLHLNWDSGPEAFFKVHFPDIWMHEAAGGLVFDQDRRLLLMIRHGVPDFPKGHLDPDETHVEAAIREVKEETGLSALEILASAGQTWHAYLLKNQWHLKHTMWYLMSTSHSDEINPQTDEGITELIWTDQRNIDDFRSRTYRSLSETLWPVIHSHISGGNPAT